MNTNNEQKERQPVVVVGHQRPDTDSAVSASVYASLLNKISKGAETYEGVMLGLPTSQTKWLFEQAGVELPRVIDHLHQIVRDVSRKNVHSINQNATLGEALDLIMRHQISVVPVLDGDRKLIGLLSDRMPTANYFHRSNTEDFLGVLFNLADIVRYFKLARWQKPETEPIGQIQLDLSEDAKGSLVLIGNQPELLVRCRELGAACVITCASGKNESWKKAMRECPGLGVYQYSGSLMALVTQLPMAIPAAHLMQTENIISLSQDQTIHEAQAALRKTSFALPVLNPDGSLHGVLSRSEVLNAPRRRVVLVDHFERHQAAEGISDADIVEIVDHHRVGTLETAQPIRVDCRPVGSTATIISCKFAEYGTKPSEAEAKLLLGAMLADTLLLTSPTTTEIDCQQAKILAKYARVDLQRFGREVLVRNDETLERPAAELVEKDLKEFSAAGVNFAVAQIETVDRTRLSDGHLNSFSAALRESCRRNDWDFIALMITDIFRGDSIILFEARHADHIQALGVNGEVWSKCVSRKKQFLPELLRRLQTVKSS